jgi:hypothetical protein
MSLSDEDQWERLRDILVRLVAHLRHAHSQLSRRVIRNDRPGGGRRLSPPHR